MHFAIAQCNQMNSNSARNAQKPHKYVPVKLGTDSAFIGMTLN
ncbi:Uncharacterised protein [Vibrio cholerae]|nr:Uncharacterised protein [Vibrio cholerae]